MELNNSANANVLHTFFAWSFWHLSSEFIDKKVN